MRRLLALPLLLLATLTGLLILLLIALEAAWVWLTGQQASDAEQAAWDKEGHGGGWHR